MEKEITPEKAAFIEEKTAEMASYVIECFDRAHAEGNVMLKWLFAVITGGLTLIGALEAKGYHPLSVGAAVAVLLAAHASSKLIAALKSRDTMPPGNLAESLNTMLDDSLPRMRWREACGIDARIKANLEQVRLLATAVDNARIRFSEIPGWFILGVLLSYVLQYLLFH